jgi:hypothetical protein
LAGRKDALGRLVSIRLLGVTRSTLADRDELVVAIEKHAGMPAAPVREVIEGVSLVGDIYT